MSKYTISDSRDSVAEDTGSGYYRYKHLMYHDCAEKLNEYHERELAVQQALKDFTDGSLCFSKGEMSIEASTELATLLSKIKYGQL